MHLDHGNSVETCKSAIELGFTRVMMDGSLMPDGKTPSSFDYNVEVTTRKWWRWRTPRASRWKAKSACWAASKTATAPAAPVSST